MAKHIFGKSIAKKCEICIHSAFSESSEKLVCEKKGLVLRDAKCLRFRYDPCKRVPNKTVLMNSAAPEDFEL